MKKYFLLSLLVGLLFAGSFVTRTTAEEPKNERAVVQFDQTVKLKDVFLRGQYLFIHDAEMMAQGKDCTWIYDSQGNVVTSFHCRPVKRDSVDKFKVIVSRRNAAFDIPDVREIQFPGSTEGHEIP